MITKGRINVRDFFEVFVSFPETKNFTMTTEQYLTDGAPHDIDMDETAGDGIAMDPEDFESDNEDGVGFADDEENSTEDGRLEY